MTRRNSKRKQHKEKLRKEKRKKLAIANRERNRWPTVFLENEDAPTTVVKAVKRAISAMDLSDKKRFGSTSRRFFKQQKKEGFRSAIQSVFDISNQEWEIDPNPGDRPSRVAMRVMQVIGDYLLLLAPEIKGFIPQTAFRIEPLKPYGRDWLLRFSTIESRSTPNGRIYFSTNKHTATVGDQTKIMSFTSHAMKQAMHRAFVNWQSYVGMGNAHGVFQCCSYFEPTVLHNASGDSPAVSFYLPCTDSFPSWRIVEACVGDQIESDKHYYWRAGYFPLVDFEEHWVAKTFLLPGYRGTQERLLIKRSGLPWEQRRTLCDRVEDARVDIDLVAWFHKNGVEQVKSISFTT